MLCSALVLSILTGATSVLSYGLVLDPGHDGQNPGTYTALPGLYEREINLEVAFCFLDCAGAGYYIALTRTNDIDTVSFFRRVQIANDEVDADEFISIHHDGNTDPSINRTGTNYCNDPSTIWEGQFLFRDDTSSVLSMKLGLRIVQSFGLPKMAVLFQPNLDRFSL
jgi:N-acetylmuramoyl-L-alanine amidase